MTRAALTLAVVLLLAGITGADYQRFARVVRWIDGDTLVAWTPNMPEPHDTMRVRLAAIDAPEMRGGGQEEARAAKEAKRAAEALLRPGEWARLHCANLDNFGRHLCRVVRDVDGLDVGAELLRQGLVEPWEE